MEEAVSGILAAEERLAASAHNIAHIYTEEARARRVEARARDRGADPVSVQPDDRSDLVAESVEQIGASNYMAANIQSLRTQDEMKGIVLDLFA